VTTTLIAAVAARGGRMSHQQSTRRFAFSTSRELVASETTNPDVYLLAGRAKRRVWAAEVTGRHDAVSFNDHTRDHVPDHMHEPGRCSRLRFWLRGQGGGVTAKRTSQTSIIYTILL